MTQAAHRSGNPPDVTEATSFIEATTGKTARDTVVASADPAVLVLKPFWGFLQWNIHYSHPQARPELRVGLLESLAECAAPGCLEERLDAAPVERVDAFVFARGATGDLSLSTTLDGFPNPRPVTVTYRPEQFSAARWARHDVGSWTVLARRPGTNRGS